MNTLKNRIGVPDESQKDFTLIELAESAHQNGFKMFVFNGLVFSSKQVMLETGGGIVPTSIFPANALEEVIGDKNQQTQAIFFNRSFENLYSRRRCNRRSER